MRKLSIALIQPPAPPLREDRLEPHLGLLYIAAFVMRELPGAIRDIRYVDLTGLDPRSWPAELPLADLYAFTACTTNYHLALGLRDVCRDLVPGASTAIGGPHATALPQEVSGDFDYVITGEGEQAFVELVGALASGHHPPRILNGDPVRDLDELPIPAFSLADMKSYGRRLDGLPCASIMTTRGCPYRCLFCNSIVMGAGRPLRLRSPEHVVSEISWLHDRLGFRAFRFQDDSFNVDEARLHRLADLLGPMDLHLRCFARVDLLSARAISSLKRMGVRHVSLGVESGSDRMLRAMRKRQTPEEVVGALGRARKAGLVARAYLLVGFPGETWETVEQTVKLLRGTPPDEFCVYPFIPYPGTPAFLDPASFGITSIDRDFTKYFQVSGDQEAGFVFETDELSRDTIKGMRQWVIRELSTCSVWAGDSVVAA